jgi:hypothetical protein
MSYKDGEVGLRELTRFAKDEGYDEEDILEDGENAIILY